MIGTATSAAAVTQGVSTDFLQNALSRFAISLCNQVLPTHLDPNAFNLGSAIQSNLLNKSLYERLFSMMNLDESMLAQAYKGNPVINLTNSAAANNLARAINSALHQFNGDLSFQVAQLTFNTSTYELSAQVVLKYAHSWGTLADILDKVGQTLSDWGKQTGGKLSDWFKEETGIVAQWWQNAGSVLPSVPWVTDALNALPSVLQDLGEPLSLIKNTVGNLGSEITSLRSARRSAGCFRGITHWVWSMARGSSR
jgi:hypothetical protein